MLYVILMVYFHLYTVTARLDTTNCPCHISVNEDGLQKADCRNQNLTTIPTFVPNTTQWLDFQSNHLMYSPGQFQRFENLVFLSLFDNLEFAAHVDSFKRLFSLQSLNLGHTNLKYLTGKAFRHQFNLRYLGLRGGVGKFNMSLFEHLGKLESLDLSLHNEIELPNWSFTRLPFLSELNISDIISLTLHNYTFSGLSALTYLDLRNLVYSVYLPDEVFKPLIKLEELHLEGICGVLSSKFDCKAIDKRLQHVPSLKKLYIDKSLVSNLRKGFLLLSNLEELYLITSDAIAQPCAVGKLTQESFINLRKCPLRKLVLNQCITNTLESGWFKYLSKLNVISLSVTSVSYWMFWIWFSSDLANTTLNTVELSVKSTSTFLGKPKAFSVCEDFNKTKLTDLQVTHTRFYCVKDDTIIELPKSLKHLNLTYNYIIQFGVENLEYLENLETLDLSNQFDFNEHMSARSGNESLDNSNRSESRRQRLSPTVGNEHNNFRQLNQSQTNLITYSNVTRIKCLSLPHRLKVLNLRKSRLLCNMVPAFCNSNNSLKYLDASLQSDKSCFETRSFWSVLKGLAKLKELNLNGNWISAIPQGSFSGLSKLSKLTLVDNKLLEISFDVKYLISLKYLDLSVNGIQYASDNFIDQIEDVSSKTNLTLYLDKNPLLCSCKHIDFIAWLIATKVISNKKKLNCTFENGNRISIRKLSESYGELKYKCAMPDVTISCSLMFWGLSFVLVGLVYVLHNRQKLRYLVLFGKRTLNPYHPIEDNEIQMKYDVYISYEGDFNVTQDKTLRDFVVYTILPGLEQRGVRVIIREELDPGTRLYEGITHTLRRSRKVLAVLTNGYCNDMWNVFEFNQAIMEGIYTNRQVAIPVLFESLKHDKVKEEIRAFLKMEPVHRYSSDLSDRAFIDFLYERIRDTRQFG